MKLMRKKGTNTVKSAIALAFCLLLILPFLTPAAAFAAENGELPDPDRTGSFTASFKYYDESTGKTLPVAGGNSVGLYKVADVVADHGYQFVGDERFAAAGEIPATDEALDGANAELAAKMAAIASGLRDTVIPPDWAAFGEVGLAGELRAVPQAERRVLECARLGFLNIVLPRANAKRIAKPEGVRVYGADTLAEAVAILMG